MTARTVRIARSEGYDIAPLGVHTHYPPGDYQVPEEMPADHARRALESGIGIEIRSKDSKRETKQTAPPRKKKRSRKKTGRKRSS